MLFCYIPLKVFSIEVLGSYVLYNQQLTLSNTSYNEINYQFIQVSQVLSHTP